MHALSIKAMQGSILAQRTLLEYQLKEDARVRAEREERFKFWRNHIRDTEPLFAKAAARGEPAPKIYPHPSDVKLDYRALECQFVGPMNAKEAIECERRQENAAFFYELMAYCGEGSAGIPSDDNPVVGVFMFLYILEIQLLLPRLRKPSKEAIEAIERRIMGRFRDRETYLEQRGKELGYPVNPRRLKAHFLNLRDMNLRFVNSTFVEYRWPKGKKAAGA